MKRLTGFLIITFIWTGVLAQIPGSFTRIKTANSLSNPVKILFLGSSYFAFNKLVDIFQNLADSSGKEVYLDSWLGPGYLLDDHASCQVTDSMIKLLDWDFVILQGVGSYTAYPDKFSEHKVAPALRTLKRKISGINLSAKTVFCLPWAFEDGMTWMGWPDDYEDMQRKIYTNTLQLADDIGLMIAPVGWAWLSVLEVNGFPLHYLHKPDWNHPSVQGSYLMACVLYASIFQESASGIPYYKTLEKAEAQALQSTGSKTVLKDLELWHIPELLTSYEHSAGSPGFQISQNYPNPFSSTTRIEYEIEEPGAVEFTIYESSGRTVFVRKDLNGLPGKYSFSFYGQDLPDGLYYYSLKQKDNIASGKMILNKR